MDWTLLGQSSNSRKVEQLLLSLYKTIPSTDRKIAAREQVTLFTCQMSQNNNCHVLATTSVTKAFYCVMAWKKINEIHLSMHHIIQFGVSNLFLGDQLWFAYLHFHKNKILHTPFLNLLYFLWKKGVMRSLHDSVASVIFILFFLSCWFGHFQLLHIHRSYYFYDDDDDDENGSVIAWYYDCMWKFNGSLKTSPPIYHYLQCIFVQ